jgi:hypothetical protein
MRLGCSGCLSVILLLAILAGGVWAVQLALSPPDVAPVTVTRADGVSAQQKLYEVLRRSGRDRRPRPGRPVTLSERELTALVTQHVPAAAGIPLAELSIRLPGPGVAVVSGRLPLRTLLRDTPLADLVAWLPGAWQEWPVWLTIGLRPRVEPADGGRYLRLVPDSVRLGRLRLPAVTARLLLDPRALSTLAWRLPEHVTDVSVQPGQVSVIVGSSP